MSTHVISIPKCNTCYKVFANENNKPDASNIWRPNILYLNEKSMELFQYKLTCHIAKKECSAQHKCEVPAASS